jgi:hypothetical protein
VFWGTYKNHYLPLKPLMQDLSKVKIKNNFSATELRATFRIEKKKVSRLTRNWQALCFGLQLCYSPSFFLNLMTGTICLTLISSITLLQKLPLESYCSSPPHIVLLLNNLPADKLQNLKQTLSNYPIVESINHIAPQPGFKELISKVNLKKSMAVKAEDLPHAITIKPKIKFINSSQLSIFLKDLKKIEGINYIQLDEPVFQSVFTQYQQNEKRIYRFIGLLFIMTVVIMIQHLYRIWHYTDSLLLSFLYHPLWIISLITSIANIGFKQISKYLSLLFLIPEQFGGNITDYYLTNFLNTVLVVSISILLSRFFKKHRFKNNQTL